MSIQAIESVNSAAKHKVVDLFVLLILHSTANRKKSVESLIRNKIKNGNFTEEMLTAAFNSHSQVRVLEWFVHTCINSLYGKGYYKLNVAVKEIFNTQNSF